MTKAHESRTSGIDNNMLEAQHRQLLALCQQASQLLNDDSPAGRESFHALLNDLASYAREHFAAEEEQLRRTNPALLASHRAEHISYESRVTDLLISACAGILDKNSLQRFLTEWWSSHVLKSDKHLTDSPKQTVQNN